MFDISILTFSQFHSCTYLPYSILDTSYNFWVLSSHERAANTSYTELAHQHVWLPLNLTPLARE